MFEALGRESGRDFFLALKANEVQVTAGNKQVAEDVAHGRLAFGLTDTDDALIEIDHGFPVQIVYPDSLPSQIGTLFIPNTVCILRECQHPVAAKQLIDYLVDGQIEEQLALGPSGQIPLSSSGVAKVGDALRVASPSTIHAMDVDFAKAVRRWKQVGGFLQNEFMESNP